MVGKHYVSNVSRIEGLFQESRVQLLYKEGFPPLFLCKMNAHEVIEDATNNPFVTPNGEVREWDANIDVADTAIYNHIRTAIARLNFYLRHPLLGEDMDEDYVAHLRNELRLFTRALNKAHYN